MNRVISAVDSFKGSVSSSEASSAVAQGVAEVFPRCEVVPITVADGGEGTVEALVHSTAFAGQSQWVEVTVDGPLGVAARSRYGILPDNRAILEMAAASGLTLVPVEDRNPELTSTFGTGQMILDALDRGCRHILLGIGGSATNDAGVGMLQALGWRFYDHDERLIDPQMPSDEPVSSGRGGQVLRRISRIDGTHADPRLKDMEQSGVTFTVACDVTNPFCGRDGAAYVYGPQKGATPDQVEALDEGLEHFAEVIKRQLGQEIRTLPGAGAAGGLGGGLVAFLGAKLVSGIDMVLQAQDFDALLDGADCVFTGEGRLDAQSASGKVVSGIVKAAQRKHVPVIALAGAIENRDALADTGLAGAFAILPGVTTLEQAMDPATATENIRQTVAQICRVIQAFF